MVRASRFVAAFALVGLVNCAPSSAVSSAPGALAGIPSIPRPVRSRTRVALYVGPGTWPEGVGALRETLGTSAFDLEETRGAEFVGREMDVLVVGGGWSPDQIRGFGEAGLGQIRRFVRGGGGYVGICAGAYLATAQVRWEGRQYAYPLGFFAGWAEGPLSTLAPWPRSASVEVHRVAGEHAMQGRGDYWAHYFGGPAFERDRAQHQELLLYPDGRSAAIALTYGKGRVGLVGPHLEIATGMAQRDPSGSREFLRELVQWVGRRTAADRHRRLPLAN